jgi:hypothetical protein
MNAELGVIVRMRSASRQELFLAGDVEQLGGTLRG